MLPDDSYRPDTAPGVRLPYRGRVISRRTARFVVDPRGLERVPPAALVLFGMGTVQIGAALAKGLFAALSPTGVVFLRVAFAALVLLALWRPWRRRLWRAGADGAASPRD